MIDNRDDYWEIIAGKLHGELCSDEEAEFSQMILNRSNLKEFEKAKQIHDDLIKMKSICESNKVKSWAKVEKGVRGNQLSWIKSVMKYAAIITIAFVFGGLLKSLLPSYKEIRYSEIAVPFGQMSQLTLSDGTKIWLNSGTTLRYPERFAENKRDVFIEGEAYFEVAKMPDKPFIVNSEDIRIEVKGTSFNFSTYHEDAASSVTLVEGKVTLKNLNGKTIAKLIPGQKAVKGKNQTNVRIENVKTSFYSAWIEGKIFFDDEPLDKIAIKLERWFNVEINFADDRLKSHKFTGTILKNKPVDQILQALELIAPISFKHQININGKDKITICKKTLKK